MTRVLIVEDHPITRCGLRQIIEAESDLEVCDDVGDAASGMEAFRKHQPDLVLADISMPGRNGLELLKDIKAEASKALVLFVSMHDETVYAERVLRAGAVGYIMKDEAPDALIKAVRTALQGGVFVSPQVSNHIIQSFSGANRDAASPVDRLTDRELQVFDLIGHGQGNKEIAQQLGLSARTIEAHRAHIKEKLHFRAGNALIREAVRWVESNKADAANT